ncbi:MAG: M48 family metalloprotease [Halocynthiibacter sp.]
MRKLSFIGLLGLVALTACQPTQQTSPANPKAPTIKAVTKKAPNGRMTVTDYKVVVSRVAPHALAACKQLRADKNCSFQYHVHPNPKAPSNAFQSLDKKGRPMVTVTRSFLKSARNRDELAFVIGHETAHHLRAHIDQQQRSAMTGMILGGILGAAIGVDAQGVETAMRVGGTVGARQFSKTHEIQADELGAVIATRAGYNALNGVKYFEKVPDPGNRFLGTHPPNAHRVQAVHRVMGVK